MGGMTDFWDASVWSLIITLTILLVAMMAANILRRSITPLRRLMIPNAVLGGFLLLLAEGIFKVVSGGQTFIDKDILEILTYHGLGLGFVAMTLRTLEKQAKGAERTDVFNTGVTVVATYLIQALLGLGITMLLFGLMGKLPRFRAAVADGLWARAWTGVQLGAQLRGDVRV